ncbi:MAG: type II toxin-antitoxin system HicA family toxin [Caldilineae bacterium]|nr:MAG: type II toxin-antitoxin system HicA family toxin [Caldilineae bacterium]
MPRLPTVTSRQMIAALQRAGFIVHHQTGSHVVMWNVDKDLTVVVPYHNRDLGRGLTLRIIKSAGLSRDEFIRLLS